MFEQGRTPMADYAAEATTLTDSGFYWLEDNGVVVLGCQRLTDAGFANGFSTRLGGVSPFPFKDLNLAGFDEDSHENIEENRMRFLNVFPHDYRLSTVWQVHGSAIKVVRTADDVIMTEDKDDGVISNRERILAAVKTADCVPVLIGDSELQVFGAVHAGWRGTAESIVPKAIELMAEEYGSKPENLICALGPAAGCEKYEVGQEVIDAFAGKFSTSGNLFTETRPGHALIDLHKANQLQLEDSGVAASNIFTVPFCTIERTDLFFSYRVENPIYGRTGRSMAVIGIM
jgi:YfiH family protein